jgi:predicted dinucleotide-utilizing enzyme
LFSVIEQAAKRTFQELQTQSTEHSAHCLVIGTFPLAAHFPTSHKCSIEIVTSVVVGLEILHSISLHDLNRHGKCGDLLTKN